MRGGHRGVVIAGQPMHREDASGHTQDSQDPGQPDHHMPVPWMFIVSPT
jgi:hypothetical protein